MFKELRKDLRDVLKDWGRREWEYIIAYIGLMTLAYFLITAIYRLLGGK